MPLLIKFSAPVSNVDLFNNVIKGIHGLFDNMSSIAPLLVSF
jgi:hypothetical protein